MNKLKKQQLNGSLKILVMLLVVALFFITGCNKQNSDDVAGGSSQDRYQSSPSGGGCSVASPNTHIPVIPEQKLKQNAEVF